MAITPWATPTAGDDAAEAPLRTRFVDVLDNRNRHNREAVYDPAVHVPHADRPHDHCGKCSPRLYSTAVPNLLCDGIATSGWTIAGAVAQGSATGLSFTGTGASARHRILAGESGLAHDIAATKQVFGAGGCPLTLAILARKVGTVTAATLVFGLADAGSHKTGTRGTITQASLSTSFKRFFVYVPTFSASAHTTDCSVLLSTSGSFTGGGSVEATLVYLRPGHGLAYWQPGCMETRHTGWKNVQLGPASLYDQIRDFTDANQLSPT